MTNQTAEQVSVTVIGLGAMGRALAGAFLREGHRTTVWNRTAEKADELVARGAVLAGSVGEAVAASPLVVVCVTDYDAVRELLDPVDLGDRAVVNLTSGTPGAARELAGRVGAYLDGGIMATPAAVGTAEAVLVCSGSRAAFERYEPVLRGLGAETVYLGEDAGLAALYEVGVLGLMWSTLNGFLQGAALARAAGLDAASFAPLAVKSMESVAGWLPDYARQIDEGSYPPLDATIDVHLAAMRNLIEESESLGVSTELPRFVKALADRAVAEGRGEEGYAALVEQFGKPS
ncbi:NAD(P)-dependent oxidoreductase [Nonomuraea candida]|uniref:NAD(P)-dependent oxidoreductase n=1 Tax=Nonomuraea candida TaxID=359159 RepID=UPI0005B7C50E|nr:NAD(P)-binding domain-containing protein [Nonomuraea candida]